MSTDSELEPPVTLDTWRSMESAPRDGTPILVCKKKTGYDARRVTWGRVTIIRWVDGRWFEKASGAPRYQDIHLDGWRHLPPPCN